MSNNFNLLLDTHVHCYERFNTTEFLDEAFKNFDGVFKKNNIVNGIGVLVVTETENEGGINKILRDLETSNGKKYIEPTAEKSSCFIKFQNGFKILLIRGQQIITKEKLEVLSLFSNRKIEYNLDLNSTIKSVTDDGSIPIIPWGFGKWWGSRGVFLKDFLQENDLKVFLGDNSGRPSFLSFLKNKLNTNYIVLPGSDPLNIPSGIKKPGSFTCLIETELDLEYPTRFIKDKLLSLQEQPMQFGKLESPINFFLNQISLRLSKFI